MCESERYQKKDNKNRLRYVVAHLIQGKNTRKRKRQGFGFVSVSVWWHVHMWEKDWIYVPVCVHKDILQCLLPETTRCASAADHLAPHDIIIVPLEILYTHIHMHVHTLPHMLFFTSRHQVLIKVHLLHTYWWRWFASAMKTRTSWKTLEVSNITLWLSKTIFAV